MSGGLEGRASDEQTATGARQRRAKATANPLQKGIHDYLSSQSEIPWPLDIAALPKRFTLYPPLALLPVNFTTHGPQWSEVYSGLTVQSKSQLFECIASSFTRNGHAITNIAINSAISTADDESGGHENVMRSPSAIEPVFGDWGPSTLLDVTASQPTKLDFDAAFWISTKQVDGIVQTWAPRWTMFSHGNLSEKQRILGHRSSPFTGLSQDLKSDIHATDVVDMYVGIGYFALCYLARGVKRVWGWDLNGWSIEGLRRGCAANGWQCEIVELDTDGDISAVMFQKLMERIKHADTAGGAAVIRCVAFRGDNSHSGAIMSRVKAGLGEPEGLTEALSVRHVNLGLLPSSEQSWKNAVRVLAPTEAAYIHVHENVDIASTASRGEQIAQELHRLMNVDDRRDQIIRCVHAEHVKTYAPGVMHCVFDIEVQPPRTVSISVAS